MRNKKLAVLLAVAVGVVGLSAVSAMAEITTVPKEPGGSKPVRAEFGVIDGVPMYTKVAAPGDTTWIRVYDGTECDATGSVSDGGQGTGRAPGWATWCWEGGVDDTCSAGAPPESAGCFTSFDIYRGLTNAWHLDTFLAYPVGGLEDSTPWCGEFGDTLIWNNGNDWGYGPAYNWSLILDLGSATSGPNVTGFNAANGFTIGGVHMYDVEINYDYCYLEYAVSNNETLATWFEIARFHGTSAYAPCADSSGGPAPTYGCANYEDFKFAGPASDNSSTSLRVRWRFASDNAWDDEDASNGVHTDGAWRIDHIYAKAPDGTASATYPGAGGFEDFEGGLGSEWSNPSLPQGQIGGFWSGGGWVNGTPVWVDWWHLELDPTYANYGNTCTYTNNWMWAADDPNPAHPQNQEDNYHYRLVSPVFDTSPTNKWTSERWTGVVLEYDSYLCIKSIVGDVTDQQVRVHNGQAWGQWGGDNYVTTGGCQFWNIDTGTNWSSQLSATTDSIQFSWEFLDRCDYNTTGGAPIPCMGQHRKATYIIDNVSVGTFASSSTQFGLGSANTFADSYARDVGFHSTAKENWELTAADPWEDEDSLQLECRDVDNLAVNGVKIHYRLSTDCGLTWDTDPGHAHGSNAEPTVEWTNKPLVFSVPDDPGDPSNLNGAYRTNIMIGETSLGGALSLWPEGTILEYFFTAEDGNGALDTFPNRLSAARTNPDLVHTFTDGTIDRRLPWPFESKILPCPDNVSGSGNLPANQNHGVLLVNAVPARGAYDPETDAESNQVGAEAFPLIAQVWRESMDRLDVQYDEYVVRNDGVHRGSDTPFYTQPADNNNYGGIINHNSAAADNRRYHSTIWFFGRFNDPLTLADSTQLELAKFLDDTGTLYPGLPGANIYVAGNDLCEDETMSDAAWQNQSGVNTTNSGYFWQTLAGLNDFTNGCPDDAGHADGIGSQVVGLSGTSGSILASIQSAVGYWDCPLSENPDNQITASTATSLMSFSTGAGGISTFRNVLTRGGGDSKVILSTTPLELFTHHQMRDCILQAILLDFGALAAPVKPLSECNIGPDVDVPNGNAPRRVVLEQNTPNPFNPTTSIRFSIPSRQKVDLRVYDIAGREVKTLVSGQLDADTHEVQWFGLDNDGKEATSGVYFYRLNTEKESQTKKMVLIR